MRLLKLERVRRPAALGGGTTGRRPANEAGTKSRSPLILLGDRALVSGSVRTMDTTRRSPGGASRPARPRGRTESGHILDAWPSLVRRPRAVSPHIAADSPCGSTHVRAAGGE